jgi:hypothetical protein
MLRRVASRPRRLLTLTRWSERWSTDQPDNEVDDEDDENAALHPLLGLADQYRNTVRTLYLRATHGAAEETDADIIAALREQLASEGIPDSSDLD